MGDYLDLNGVAYVWEKVQELVASTVMQPATPSQAGIVTTETQWLGGIKGGEGFTSLGNFAIYRSNEGGSTNRLGRMYIERTTINNKEVTGHFTFRQYSPDSSGEMKSYSEMYNLPDVAANMSANGIYDILTSKSAVTIGQGGTGATTEAGARSNLGVGEFLISDSTFSASSSAATLTNGAKYSLLTFLGRTSGDKVTIDGGQKNINTGITVPVTNLTTSNVVYELSDYYGSFIFALKTSGDDVIMTYVSATDTSNGRVVRVYGTV